MGRFETPLCCRKLAGNDSDWILLSPLIFYSEIAGCYISAEAGFITDFASVPRLPVIYVCFGGVAPEESTIHDFCYRKGLFTRKICDLIYLEALESRGWRSQIQCHSMYIGVVNGGTNAYKGSVDGYPPVNVLELIKPKGDS